MRPYWFSSYRRARLNSPINYWSHFLRAPFALARVAFNHQDARGLQVFYLWNVLFSALVVSVRELLAIANPAAGVLHALAGGAIVLLIGLLWVPIMGILLAAMAGFLHLIPRWPRVQVAVMATGPWLLMSIIVSALQWTLFLAVLILVATMLTFVHGIAHALYIGYRRSLLLVSLTFSIMGLITFIILLVVGHPITI